MKELKRRLLDPINCPWQRKQSKLNFKIIYDREDSTCFFRIKFKNTGYKQIAIIDPFTKGGQGIENNLFLSLVVPSNNRYYISKGNINRNLFFNCHSLKPGESFENDYLFGKIKSFENAPSFYKLVYEVNNTPLLNSNHKGKRSKCELLSFGKIETNITYMPISR